MSSGSGDDKSAFFLRAMRAGTTSVGRVTLGLTASHRQTERTLMHNHTTSSSESGRRGGGKEVRRKGEREREG